MVIQLNPATPAGEAVILPMSQGPELAARLTEVAARQGVAPAWLQQLFKADQKEILAVPGPQPLWLLGLGSSLTFARICSAFRAFSHRMASRLPAATSVEIPPYFPADLVAEAAVNGLLLGRYRLGLYKTQKESPAPWHSAEARLFIQAPHGGETLDDAVRRGQVTAEVQLRVFDLVNMPANKLTPLDLAAWARESGLTYGYQVFVMDKSEIEIAGMHALLSVNRGSELPPVCIVAHYKHEGIENPVSIGLVGKGITFDTGGISLKDSNNMHLMKCDMAGAAAVLGTIELAARLALPVEIVAIVPSTENSIDAEATFPGDVIRSYAGKTIEVIDTDAEGRLILADGLSYLCRNYQPDKLVDLATLTGNCVMALGNHAAGLFTANDRMAVSLAEAGHDSGERVWRLPLWEEYMDDMKSDIADIRNFSGKPTAGAITAAKFLEVFTDQHPAWAHLDIAGVAFTDSEFAGQRSATAWGIRLLTTWMQNLD
ncbi:MAG: M17 family metallopeptidase [Bacteroidia bacterium]|nr:M17 family metallopeptidase [Bacteroidia bacterium]